MCFDAQNIKFLQSVYPYLNRKETERWYWKFVRQRIQPRDKFGRKRVHCLANNKNGMVGGSREVFDFEYNGKKYQIGVVTSIGSKPEPDSDFDDEEEKTPDMNVYFLSVIETKTYRRCGLITISPDYSDIGVIVDLNRYYSCLPGERTGRVILNAMIQYCRLNQETLKINGLELEDNATYTCPGTNSDINLLISNQLLGRLPFYMEYGFQPVDPIALRKISENLSTMKTYTLNSVNLVEIIREYNESLPSSILSLIETSDLETPLIDILTQISKSDCELYSSFYEELFIILKLKKLRGNEPLFRLMFDVVGTAV